MDTHATQPRRRPHPLLGPGLAGACLPGAGAAHAATHRDGAPTSCHLQGAPPSDPILATVRCATAPRADGPAASTTML